MATTTKAMAIASPAIATGRRNNPRHTLICLPRVNLRSNLRSGAQSAAPAPVQARPNHSASGALFSADQGISRHYFRRGLPERFRVLLPRLDFGPQARAQALYVHRGFRLAEQLGLHLVGWIDAPV